MIRRILYTLVLIVIYGSAAHANPNTLSVRVGNLYLRIPYSAGVSITFPDKAKLSVAAMAGDSEEKLLNAAVEKYGTPLPAIELILNFRHLCDDQRWKPCLPDGKFSIPLDTMTIAVPRSDLLETGTFKHPEFSLEDKGIPDEDLYERDGSPIRCVKDDCLYFLLIRDRAIISFKGFNLAEVDGNGILPVERRSIEYLRIFLAGNREKL